MVKIKIPPSRMYAYKLFAGAYDGAIFVCGPGAPYDPPASLTLEDKMPNGKLVAHRYALNDTHDGYNHVPETKKKKKP